MLVASLQRINDAQNLGRISSRRSRVGHDQADGFLRVNDEDRSNGKGDALLVDIGGILIVQPNVFQDTSAMSGVITRHSLMLADDET